MADCKAFKCIYDDGGGDCMAAYKGCIGPKCDCWNDCQCCTDADCDGEKRKV